MKISVCLVIRNGEPYIKYMDKLFTDIENIYPDYVFEYFMYENNSTDNTQKEIEHFYKNKKGKYILDDIPNKTINSGISLERGEHMTIIRNKLKDFHGKLDSDFVLLLDAEVVFLPDTLIELINTINNDIVMVTPFGMCYYAFSYNDNVHYYDSLAVISKDNISYEETSNTCLFKCCKTCRNNREKKNINIDEDQLFDLDKIIPVNSCFGSLALIKTQTYNQVSWDNSICEHHSFCKNVSNHGSIVINPKIKIFKTISQLNNYDIIEQTLKIFLG